MIEKEILIPNKENINKCIKAIGQELIRRADKISDDIEKVSTITIYATLTPEEIVNFDITKNYIAEYKQEKNKKEAE